MSRTFSKLTRRGIKHSLSRFLSIFGIVAIGTGFLAGLLATAPDMEENAAEYYNAQNAYDVEVQCNLGLTKKDAQAMKKLDYISDAVPMHMEDVQMETGGEETYVTRVFGVDFNKEKSGSCINNFELLSGRLPEKDNECVIEVPNAYGKKHAVGETVTISKDNEDYKGTVKHYKYKEYTVTGIVKSPLFVSMTGEMSSVGDGTVSLAAYVKEDVCRQEAYSVIYATVKGASKLDPFSEEYTDRISKVTGELKSFGKVRADERRSEIVAKAMKKIGKAEKKYKKNAQKARSELSDAAAQIQSGKNEISSAEATLSDKKADLANSKATLDSQEKKLDAVRDDIEQAKKLRDSGVPLPDKTLKQIEKYDEGRSAIKEGRKKIKNGRKQINEARAKIDTSKEKLAAGETAYEKTKTKTEKELKAAKKKIDDAKKEASDIEKGKWYLTDRSDNAGISGYKSDIEKVTAVATVFPIFFFLVAALVALTTMTRMIEEERLQTGILKSLGYSSRNVLGYYVKYSLLASVSGCIVGEGIGFAVFPKVISNAYSMEYNMDSVTPRIIWPLALAVSGVTILCILLTTYFACRHELKEKPAELMLPRAPQKGKRIWLEYITPLWKHIKFSGKVTMRNLFRYKKRFLMTIIGVAGCFALLLTGFGVRDSIGDIVNLQYNELNRYSITVQVDSENAVDENKDLKATLNNKDDISGWCRTGEKSIKIAKGNEKQNTDIVVPEDADGFTDYVTLRDRKTKEKVKFDTDSVVLTEKMAESLGAKTGDTVKLDLKNGNVKKVKVTGICEYYVQSKVFMGRDIYETAFGRTPEYSTLLIQNAKGVSSDKVASELLKYDDVNYALSSETVKKNFNDSVGSIDYIVMVLIIAAGALAMVVLYNLTNVNVCERKKELATIKVLGFYEREVSAYIFRETNILSVLGMIAGVPLGIWLHSFVIKTAEVDAVMFGRQIYWQSYIYAFAITLFFTFLVNLIMRKTIKNIDMVESMKAND